MATVITTASQRRKRLKLKRIVVSEHNYLALKELGHAGDSFNDVVSKLLRVYRTYQEKKQQEEQRQHQENDEESYITNNGGLPFPGSLSALFDEHERQQQLADLLGLRRRKKNRRKSQPIKEESE